MSRVPDNQFEPLCRFGPGGDFVSAWPSESQKQPLRPAANGLSKLLDVISEIISAVVGSDFDDNSSVGINSPGAHELNQQCNEIRPRTR